MLRKLALALAASVALGAAALSPTAASAHGWGHHWGHGWGHGYGFGPVIVAGGYADDASCYVQRRVRTPYGIRWRTVNVCY
ncbi:MAG: hypothetical protein BGN84_15575 [Afipia sp. 62-7]|nr:hypothetical protein [Afipia sp.]OJU18770.1 MAG: hypothetical protein BGN84_15575 [Afipia sp. 62-7]